MSGQAEQMREWLTAQVQELQAVIEDRGSHPAERERADHWQAAFRKALGQLGTPGPRALIDDLREYCEREITRVRRDAIAGLMHENVDGRIAALNDLVRHFGLLDAKPAETTR